jgi:hypothetical protein
MGVIALVASAAALAGPPALPPLPAQGLAVTDPRGITLVDLRGRRVARLAGYKFVTEYLQSPGLPRLRDLGGRRWQLNVRMHRLVRAEGGLGLAGGSTVAFARGTWILRRGERVLLRLRHRLPYFDEDRTAVSTGRRTVDLATGRRLAVPSGCVLASRRAPRWILLCDGELPTSIEELVDGVSRILAGPAYKNAQGAAGYWQYVRVAPDGRRLLAQWSGECESPSAFFVTAGKWLAAGDKSLESFALGWSRDGRALVYFPQGLCGGTFHGGPGVYALGRGKPQRLVAVTRMQAVAFWG